MPRSPNNNNNYNKRSNYFQYPPPSHSNYSPPLPTQSQPQPKHQSPSQIPYTNYTQPPPIQPTSQSYEHNLKLENSKYSQQSSYSNITQPIPSSASTSSAYSSFQSQSPQPPELQQQLPNFQYPPQSYQHHQQQQQQQYPPQYPSQFPPQQQYQYQQLQYDQYQHFQSPNYYYDTSQTSTPNIISHRQNFEQKQPVFPERLKKCILCSPFHSDMSEMEFKITFSYFGCIDKILRADQENGVIIVFTDKIAAESAIKRQRVIIHGHDVQISPLTVQHDSYLQHGKELGDNSASANAQHSNDIPKTKNPPCSTVWVGNLPQHVLSSLQTVDQTLRPHFERFGTIESIRYLESRGCAFVNFSSESEASHAIENLFAEKLTIDGIPVRLDFGKKTQSNSTTQDESIPTPVPPPSDPEVKSRIYTAAQYYIRNGPQFEERIKNVQANNPKLSFLFPGGAHHGYYRWQIHCLSSQNTSPSERDDNELLSSLLGTDQFKYDMNNVPMGIIVDTCNELKKEGRKPYDVIDFSKLIQISNNNNNNNERKEEKQKIPKHNRDTSFVEVDLEDYFETIQEIDPKALQK